MLRLTLRSRDDGRFLARVIERDGFAFVLDYGDPSTVADASERVATGFSVLVDGAIQQVQPSSKQLLARLADYYEQEGLLVKLEEQNVASYAPAPSPVQSPAPLAEGLEVPHDPEEDTEMVPVDVALGDQVTVIRKKVDLDEETLRLSAPIEQKPMYAPEAFPESGDADTHTGSLSNYLEDVLAANEEWQESDEEETELVPMELRRRVIRGEDLTESHSESSVNVQVLLGDTLAPAEDLPPADAVTETPDQAGDEQRPPARDAD